MARLQNKKQAAVTTDPMGGGWSREVRIGLAKTIQPRRIKMIKLDRTDTPAVAEHATVYLAFELSVHRSPASHVVTIAIRPFIESGWTHHTSDFQYT
jgi:hypothetical protein